VSPVRPTFEPPRVGAGVGAGGCPGKGGRPGKGRAASLRSLRLQMPFGSLPRAGSLRLTPTPWFFPSLWTVCARHLRLSRHGRAREPQDHPIGHRTKSAAKSVGGSSPSAEVATAAKAKLANEPAHPWREPHKNPANGWINLDLPGFGPIHPCRTSPCHPLRHNPPSIPRCAPPLPFCTLHFALCTLHFPSRPYRPLPHLVTLSPLRHRHAQGLISENGAESKSPISVHWRSFAVVPFFRSRES